MSTHRPGPLDTEERDLARRLARLGGAGEPSPSLDANILAAAHAAAAKRPTSWMQRRPRWPAAFGVAASLALAVGVAWQLRPLPQGPVYEEAAAAAMDASATVGGPSADAAGMDTTAPMAPPSPMDAVENRTSSAQMETEQSQAKSAAFEDPASGAAAAGQAPVVSKTAAVLQSQPPPPPAPPAAAATSAPPEFVQAPPAPLPSAPPAERRTRAEQAARASNLPSRAVPATAPAQRDDTANDAVLSDAAAAAEASEEGFDERPPNTADAPEVRLAWLQRIRELIASGDTAAARDSLQEFKRRYPGVALPDDLRRFDRPL